MRASPNAEDPDIRRVLLVTTDADALSEFRQVLPVSVETILVDGVQAMSEMLTQVPMDAAILDLDVIGETINEAYGILHGLRNAAPDLVIVALTRFAEPDHPMKSRRGRSRRILPSLPWKHRNCGSCWKGRSTNAGLNWKTARCVSNWPVNIRLAS